MTEAAQIFVPLFLHDLGPILVTTFTEKIGEKRLF
jgi:hypothetical protein